MPDLGPTFFALALIVMVGFTVEAALGFGSTIVVVALGSFFVSIDTLLPAFVPLNLVLSTVIVLRQRRAVDLKLLLTRIVPAMVIGIPIGLSAFRYLPERWLARTFALFVLVLGSIELHRELARSHERDAPSAVASPLRPTTTWAMLLIGGVIHGAFATGGPMAVYVAGRLLGNDKARFRATLSTLWLVLNAILIGGYFVMHRVTRASVTQSALLAMPLALGIVGGEWLHHRVSMRAFRVGVFALLTIAGVVLFVKG
jgi:uncharacterized membrane protein YfcA